MRPDATLFVQHVAGPEFQAGIDRGDWGFLTEDPAHQNWPVVIIWVSAREKPGKPDRYYFRFELSGYPAIAPTACPWDAANNRRLDNALWPRGNALVSRTFNYGWNASALYTPCDRLAMTGHDIWKTQFPNLWWQPSFTIVVYLSFIHSLLHSSDYARS